MNRFSIAVLTPSFLIALCVAMCAQLPANDAGTIVDFNRDIRPLLSDRCFACHGPDENARQADLRLDKRDSAFDHVIKPGHAADSEIIDRITSNDPEVRMPPPDAEKPPLTEAEVALMRCWVEQGAVWKDHWAFVAPTRPEVPTVNNVDWPANPIDHFLLAAFEQSNSQPSPAADRRTLIRRLHFDVVGLPPRPATVQAALLTDEDWDTYFQRHVDELLQSPAYGERLASYWLDVVRYADSCGIHGDQLMSMSPYRDYVITAFNDNMPFDRFITEQLAGDLLPDATIDQRIASAFNRLHMITAEGGAQNKEYLAIYAADRVRNTSSALMGVTMGCSQCHDHKFDPFTTRQFYEFAAFFADLKESGVYGGNNWFPQLLLPTDEQAAELDRLNTLTSAAEKRVTEAKAFEEELKQSPASDDSETNDSDADVSDTNDQIAKATAARETAEKERDKAVKARDEYRDSIRSVVVSESVEPREMRVLPRGNWLDDSGDVVQPRVPEFLLTLAAVRNTTEATNRPNRLDLAAWMTHRNHPLVARVFVNRLWKLFYGRGIVPSLDDFGFQGYPPTYPELLDWLTIEFIDSGWDVKHIVRLMVTARAYQQSSNVSASMRQADPSNTRFARQSRFRLDVEMIRDNALSVSRLLADEVGGRSVRPYQPDGYYAHLNFPRRTYQPETDQNLWRRTVYTHWQRTFLHPSLKAFDAPTREECTVDRPRSNTPLQSLVLLNDPIYVEAARALATQVLLSKETTTDDRINTMFQLALQRDSNEEERITLCELLAQHQRRFTDDAKSTDALLSVGTYKVPDGTDRAELAAWTSLARVVLSLHESIVRY